jgi:hypothetical protein
LIEGGKELEESTERIVEMPPGGVEVGDGKLGVDVRGASSGRIPNFSGRRRSEAGEQGHLGKACHSKLVSRVLGDGRFVFADGCLEVTSGDRFVGFLVVRR